MIERKQERSKEEKKETINDVRNQILECHRPWHSRESVDVRLLK